MIGKRKEIDWIFFGTLITAEILLCPQKENAMEAVREVERGEEVAKVVKVVKEVKEAKVAVKARVGAARLKWPAWRRCVRPA